MDLGIKEQENNRSSTKMQSFISEDIISLFKHWKALSKNFIYFHQKITSLLAEFLQVGYRHYIGLIISQKKLKIQS